MTQQQTVSRMNPAGANPVVTWSEAPLGPIYSFVPAGDARRARELTGELVDALRTHLSSAADCRTVLLADFLDSTHVEPRPFIITCADLMDADPGLATFTVRLSEAVFVISTTDEVALEDAREKAVWVRSLKRDECAGLVLLPVSGGVSAAQAAHITGLPVCAVVRDAAHVRQLACWIAQD